MRYSNLTSQKNTEVLGASNPDKKELEYFSDKLSLLKAEHAEYSKIKNNLPKIKLEEQEILEKLVSLKKEYSVNEENKKTLEKEIKKLELLSFSIKENNNKESAKLNLELSELIKKINELESKKNDLVSEYEKIQKTNEINITKSKETLEKIIEDTKKNEQIIISTVIVIEKQEEIINEKKSEIVNLEKEIEEGTKKMDNLNLQISNLNSKLKSLSLETKEQEKNIDKAKKDSEKINKENEDKKNELVDREALVSERERWNDQREARTIEIREAIELAHGKKIKF